MSVKLQQIGRTCAISMDTINEWGNDETTTLSLSLLLDVLGNSLTKLTRLAKLTKVHPRTSMCTLQIVHQSGVCAMNYVLMYSVEVL